MSGVRVQAEGSLQAEILLRLKASGRPILPLVTPNGIYIEARSDDERRMRARLVARMKASGMIISGAPDLVLLWPGGAALVEIKRPAHRDVFGFHAAGTPSEDQRAFQRRAQALGLNHGYCRSWDGLVVLLAEWGAPVGAGRPR